MGAKKEQKKNVFWRDAREKALVKLMNGGWEPRGFLIIPAGNKEKDIICIKKNCELAYV